MRVRSVIQALPDAVSLVGTTSAIPRRVKIAPIVRVIVLVRQANVAVKAVVSGRVGMAVVRPLMGRIARLVRKIVCAKRIKLAKTESAVETVGTALAKPTKVRTVRRVQRIARVVRTNTAKAANASIGAETVCVMRAAAKTVTTAPKTVLVRVDRFAKVANAQRFAVMERAMLRQAKIVGRARKTVLAKTTKAASAESVLASQTAKTKIAEVTDVEALVALVWAQKISVTTESASATTPVKWTKNNASGRTTTKAASKTPAVVCNGSALNVRPIGFVRMALVARHPAETASAVPMAAEASVGNVRRARRATTETAIVNTNAPPKASVRAMGRGLTKNAWKILVAAAIGRLCETARKDKCVQAARVAHRTVPTKNVEQTDAPATAETAVVAVLGTCVRERCK